LKLLDLLARICALLGGALLTVITFMVCASLIGRNTSGWTLVGDFELTASAAGAAIALFMPLAQVRGNHIIVDFFTMKSPAAAKAFMDRIGALLLAMVMALLAWRSLLGGLSAWDTGAGSMMLGFPEWIVYCGIVPPLMLSAVIALVQAVTGDLPEAQA
jgi:TRAP-type C4-dicarboxylate transport system permease small subunit